MQQVRMQENRDRVWTSVTNHKLRIVLGIIIYMGVFGKTSFDDYWSTSERYPQHSVSDCRVPRTRWRPRITSSNGNAIREHFQDAPSAAVDIPKIIDDYNNHVNGVDISDQYRSYYGTQLPVCRHAASKQVPTFPR
ncbi:hypothetical protein BGZ88_001686 [Linnemannia elongata]|nr:hypothetical protein BGZ88_001686 [Linnemannia elongata]